jgi:HEPN domain-containing protein
MPPDRLAPTDPREWLNRAKSNLAYARIRPDDVYLEDLCFNLQQAAEKAFKGLLLQRGIRFPHSHNIGDLVALLESAGIAVPDEIRPAVRLTEFAVESRYPGPVEPVTETEYESALAISESVVGWIEHLILSYPDHP